MYKRIIYILSFSISFLFLSCSQNTNNPVSPNNSPNGGSNILAKTSWFTSPTENWTTGGWSDSYHHSYPSIVEDYSFSFYTIQNYNFSFNWSHGGWTINVAVNGTSVGSFDFFIQDYVVNHQNYYTDWYPFTYNSKNMKVRFWIYDNMEYNYVTGKTDDLFEPRTVQVQVQEQYIEPPTGFSVSPSEHSNLNQVVTLNWDPSTDTDVTGYEIYRQRWYIGNNGYMQSTGFSLVQTISSRATSSWQDSPAWGTNPHIGLRYDYEIRSVSSTLNMQSSFSSGSSIESDYWNYLP